MTEDDEEKVCLDKEQMNNIIDAARADESDNKKRIKKACPKAMSFVRGFRPKKKKSERNEHEIIIDHFLPKIKSKFSSWLSDMF